MSLFLKMIVVGSPQAKQKAANCNNEHNGGKQHAKR